MFTLCPPLLTIEISSNSFLLCNNLSQKHFFFFLIFIIFLVDAGTYDSDSRSCSRWQFSERAGRRISLALPKMRRLNKRVADVDPENRLKSTQ